MRALEAPGMSPIYLQTADYNRIDNISKRLNISETEVIQASLKIYEDALDAIEAARNKPTCMSFELFELEE